MECRATAAAAGERSFAPLSFTSEVSTFFMICGSTRCDILVFLLRGNTCVGSKTVGVDAFVIVPTTRLINCLREERSLSQRNQGLNQLLTGVVPVMLARNAEIRNSHISVPVLHFKMCSGAGLYDHARLRVVVLGKVPPVLSSRFSNKDGSPGMEYLRSFALLGAGVSGLLSFITTASADEAEHGLPCPNYSWPHQGILSSYDHGSIRRGHQIYQQVCASCHSKGLISYRDLVGVAYTEEETKPMAAEIEVVDGPKYLMMRVKCLLALARHNGQNYVFALLIGYRDPPAGVSLLSETAPARSIKILPFGEVGAACMNKESTEVKALKEQVNKSLLKSV
ncbi:hypothetical protein RHGRI_035133 [Rhododendron griersonianum]|uniref:Cytochrome c domain-containing protein n=1 Tax=Rhododendron griersonianum TaxID=479676 RepID=A0AAV6I3D1_9ERIC|nr:hypothetical protein RHGRI_035133 [Rhododendron griersonianum]